MTEDKKATAMEWALLAFNIIKFIIASALFAYMLYIHASVREVSIFAMAIPGMIMGARLDKLLEYVGKK